MKKVLRRQVGWRAFQAKGMPMKNFFLSCKGPDSQYFQLSEPSLSGHIESPVIAHDSNRPYTSIMGGRAVF